MNQSQAMQYIEQLSEKGELEEATRRYSQIAIDLINDEGDEEVLCCKTPDELATWIRRDAVAWQEKLSEESFAERFEVGHGRAYACIEQMLSCIDYELVLDLLGEMHR